MKYVVLTTLATALSVAAVPAAATIQIFSSPGAIQPSENVLFQVSPPSGVTALGVTNQTSTGVTFTGNELLATPSQGQARIEAADGGLNALAFRLTNPALGFKEVEFNIFGTQATATSVLLKFTDQFGTIFSLTSAIGSGQNFFSARALDSQFITNVSFTLNGNVADVRQFRIGGIAAVPEPEVWAMLILGFGMTGYAARRRRSTASVTA